MSCASTAVVIASILTFAGAETSSASEPHVNHLLTIEGHIRVAIVVSECSELPPTSWAHINSAAWTVNRLNALKFTAPLSLGLSVFRACTEDDYYDIIFELFTQNRRSFCLGVFSDTRYSEKMVRLGNSLEMNLREIDFYNAPLVGATTRLLTALDLTENITVYSQTQNVLYEFYRQSRAESICVANSLVLDERSSIDLSKLKSESLVVFGDYGRISDIIANLTFDDQEEKTLIFVPLGKKKDMKNYFPEGSYVIQPSYSEDLVLADSSQFVPNPLLFDVANPIVDATENASKFIQEYCDASAYNTGCLQTFIQKMNRNKISPLRLLDLLKIDALADRFTYNVLRVTNASEPNLDNHVRIYSYSMFNRSLTNLQTSSVHDFNSSSRFLCSTCLYGCLNFMATNYSGIIIISPVTSRFQMRSEAWVFGFLSISVLGVVFCIAVLIFLVIRFCKRDILEGNPVLTIFLLFSVVLMYFSVILFAITGSKDVEGSIRLARALFTSLTYAFAFSLLLSRNILLATAFKGIGFTSHISGSVQAFLTLFIFGVQGTLSLHFLNKCENVFQGASFIYMLSYNIILLILLLLICPLNIKVQRNYKEGKYFTVAVALIACTWACWIPSYLMSSEKWKDPLLCLGLVLTASILLGAVFIPRTYIMTIAATKDRLTSTIPSLPATSSIVDVYRASVQPIYECTNVAAITAAAATQNGVSLNHLPDLSIYSNIDTPLDDDSDFERCITPSQDDKVTRF